MNLYRRAALAAFAVVALCAQAFGAGTIPLSGTQQFDTLGRPLSGGLLYTFQSGTTTPQSAFQDQALTIPYPNPMVLDASGRAPFFYLADGNIKIRLTNSNGGNVLVAADGLLVIGPSFGGGGGAGVDPTTVLATGDVKARYGTGVLTGFVRLNGRTLGSATSGATELASSTAQALFEYLWTADANLVVSTGRGLTANADWLANKTITLPDMRGRTLAGMDDMGATAASRLTTSFFGASAIVLGAVGGSEQATLTLAQTPVHAHTGTASGTTGNQNAAHTHSGTTGGVTAAHAHSFGFVQANNVTAGPNAGGVTGGTTTTGVDSPDHAHNFVTGNESANHQHGFTSSLFTTNSQGSGSAHATASPSMVMTIYQKL